MKQPDKFKTFFLITLLPYAYILYNAFHVAINGKLTSFLMDTVHYIGLSGFIYGLLEATAELIKFPLLPICMIYQVAYVIHFIVRQAKSNVSRVPLGVAAFITVVLVSSLYGWTGYVEYKEEQVKERFIKKLENDVGLLVEEADVMGKKRCSYNEP